MPAKKIIAIVGATGSQGGALLRAIVNEGEKSEFAVRAITRDVNSEKSQALKKLGVEVVQADVNNEEQLVKAFEGCYGAYCVTFFWDHFSAEKEIESARAMANAAKKTGLKHVVWSTLEDTRKFVPIGTTMPTLMEKYNVPHFDAKGESDQFFADLPTTYMLTSFYWDNFIYFGCGPKKGTDGKLHLNIPMGKRPMPGIAVDDIGKCALGFFKHPESTIGKRIGVAGENLTGDQMAEKLSKALDKEVTYSNVSWDAYRALGFPGADEMGNMFQFYHDCDREFIAARNIDEARKYNPELMNLDQWLEKKKSYIPIDA